MSRLGARLATPGALVALAMALLALFLASELPPALVHTNDMALHVSLARGIERNRTLDFWHPTDLGYPVLRVYQPLYHLGLALLDVLTAGRLGLSWWASVSLFALAFALPLGVFLGLRRWLEHEGFPAAEAAWTAALAALLSVGATSFTGFGFDPLQGLWRGYGVVTQTWAMVFFAPAFARATGYLRGRERSPWPALGLIFLVSAASLIVGVMLAMAVGLRVALALVLERGAVKPSRLFILGAGAVLVTSALWLPMVQDVPWVHYPARLFAAWVNEGFGQRSALSLLFSGKLHDGRSLEALGRLPVMTVLVLLGLAVCARRVLDRPGAMTFLVAGYGLWFSFFVGRQAWGSLLYRLPLLRSYQWGRFETMLQFWGVVLAAFAIAATAGRSLQSPRRVDRAVAPLAVAAVIAALLWSPFKAAIANRGLLAAARAGQGARHAEEIAARLAGDPTRTAVGGPTTWEAEVKEGGVWLGVSVVAHGTAAAGRIFQGMDIAAGMSYLWDGRSVWGGQLLGIGNWLAPCTRTAELPVLPPAVEVAPGICLTVATQPPPLGFYSPLAGATAPVAVAEERMLDLQKEALARANQDVFLPFELRPGAPPVALPARTAPLVPLGAHGSRFGDVAPGIAQSLLEVNLTQAGAVVFPVPFHPRLEGSIDDVPARPFPVVPGFAALKVGTGTHRLALTYRGDRTKDVLFVLAVVALLVGPLVERRVTRRPAAPPVRK